MRHPDIRNTINLESADVLSHQPYPGDQYLLRLHSPHTAKEAKPGNFIHIRCDPSLLMRRPMSIMRANPTEGWIDILYKAYGRGTRLLATREIGDSISLLGPIGVPFNLHNYRKRPLLIGGGVGIPPMVFLAEHIKNNEKTVNPLMIMGSEIPFPFKLVPSRILIPGIPEGVIATMPLMEDWKIPCRLTSLQGYAGCHEGYVTDLAQLWLAQFGTVELETIEIFSCGPMPMLKAVAKLARDFNLPCQISIEETMACATGGCAGCAVQTETETGSAMKRVCVDGPVFDASTVFSNG